MGTNVSEEHSASIFRAETHMLQLTLCCHDCEDVEVGIQSFDAVWICTWVTAFRRNISPVYLGLRMEVVKY